MRSKSSMSVANAESRHTDYASDQISLLMIVWNPVLRILESLNGSVEKCFMVIYWPLPWKMDPEWREQNQVWHLFAICGDHRSIMFLKRPWGTSLVVQWLRLCPPSARGPGLIPGQRARSWIQNIWIPSFYPNLNMMQVLIPSTNIHWTPMFV